VKRDILVLGELVFADEVSWCRGELMQWQ